MLSALSKRRVAPYGAADVPGKTGMRRHARRRAREHVGESRFGQQGGKTKNPPCQSARRASRKLYQLFSSFLRGASCPKSQRVAATAASSLCLTGMGKSREDSANPGRVMRLGPKKLTRFVCCGYVSQRCAAN